MIHRRLTKDPADRSRRLGMIIRRCRTMSAVRVAQYLATLEGRYEKVVPSRERIAAATGICERSVTRAIAELEAAGAVRVWRDTPHCRKNGTWTRGRTNLYRLTWPPKHANAQVAPKGHAMHLKAFHKAIGPNGGAHSSAPTPLEDPLATLFTDEPPPDEPEKGPPWLEQGIPYTEWVRRGCPPS